MLCTLIITSISISLSLFAMDEPIKDPYQDIETKHNEKLNMYINMRAGLSDSREQIEKYHNKLFNLEQTLRNKEQELLENIQKVYSPNKPLWQGCMNIIEKLKNINKANKTRGLSNFVQDKNLPYVFMRMIAAEARKNDINIQRINIQNNQNSSQFLLTGEPCIANCSIQQEDDKRYIAIKADDIIPGTIKVNMELFIKRSVEDKRIACMYLIEPIVQEFAFEYRAIELFEELYLPQFNDISASEQYKNLTNFHMQLCALLPSLRSKEAAESMKRFHSTVRSEKLLELGNYDYLCKINRYWDIIIWLKTYACTKRSSF